LGNPQRPLLAIVAGSKVSTKLTILKSLAAKVDQLIVGGGIANTFLLAAGKPIGKSLAEPDLIGEARAVIELMKARGAEVPLPEDVVVANDLAAQGRSACSSSISSRRAPKRLRWPLPARRLSPSPAAVTRSPLSRSSASPTRCRTSPPAAARFSSSSRAESCPPSRSWRNGRPARKRRAASARSGKAGKERQAAGGRARFDPRPRI